MPLRPCASCSKRSCMASRSPAPSLRLIPRNLLHFFCDCVPSNQVFSHHWGQRRLKDEMGLLSTRQPVMSNRESLCTRREKGWSNHIPSHLVVGGCRHTLIASRREDLQVEHPVVSR